MASRLLTQWVRHGIKGWLSLVKWCTMPGGGQEVHHANDNCTTDCELQESLFFFLQDYNIEQASIFTGEEELFAFERTVSRLTEMQTEDYWQSSRSHRKGMETDLLLWRLWMICVKPGEHEQKVL